MKKIVLFANTDWYLFNFRLPLAHALKKNGWDVVLITPYGPYGEKLISEGFRWQPLPMERRSLNPLSEIKVICWLVRLLAAEKPTILHNFTVKCAVYGALAARLARVPGRVNAAAGMGYVFTSQDLKARILKPFVKFLMRSTLNAPRSILILQNPDDVKLFEENKLIDGKAIRLIRGSGVDCSRFQPRKLVSNGVPNMTQRPLSVILAARLLWDKGIGEYVESARILKQEGRDIKFYLAGTPDVGNPATIEQSVVEEWQEIGLLTWLGHVDDMPGLFARMDVAVLPSYREGLPRTLIEAASSGLPVITTDAPGCREVVSQDGVDGLRVPVRDSAALADAIRRLDDDRVLCIRLGIAAREKALAEFDETIVNSKTMAAYKEVLIGEGKNAS